VAGGTLRKKNRESKYRKTQEKSLTVLNPAVLKIMFGY
jgi:hypothetical protein